MSDVTKLDKDVFESMVKTAVNVIQSFKDEERRVLLKQLRKDVEKICSIEEQIKCANKITEEVTEAFNREDNTEEENNDNLMEEYKSRLSQVNPDISSSKYLVEFDRIVSSLENDEGSSDDANDDGDLRLTRKTVNVIDPITKKRMTDPVKNIICGHIYDRESVIALISVNPATLCPVPGCKYKNPLNVENMQSDIVTKTYLMRHPA